MNYLLSWLPLETGPFFSSSASVGCCPPAEMGWQTCKSFLVSFKGLINQKDLLLISLKHWKQTAKTVGTLPVIPARKRSSFIPKAGDWFYCSVSTQGWAGERLLVPPEQAREGEQRQENQLLLRNKPSSSSLHGIFRTVIVSCLCFSSPETQYLCSSYMWTVGNGWVVCDPESEVMGSIACCKRCSFRPRGRADEKQYCQILFLAPVLWGFVVFWSFGSFKIWTTPVGVFRTAACCMFGVFLSILLGDAALLARCPVADVSTLLMWLPHCSYCNVSCKISTLPWAKLISWYWCSCCVLFFSPLQILLLSHWLHCVGLDQASWGDSVTQID